MQCPRCAADNADTDRFCRRCGTLLTKADEIRYDPQQAAELVVVAWQLSDEGKLDEAIQAAEQAISLNPRSTSAHSALGILLYRKGNTERAVAEYQIVLSLSPESNADRTRMEEILGLERPRAERRWRVALIGSLVALLFLLVLTMVLFIRQAPARRGPAAGPTAAAPPAAAAPPSAGPFALAPAPNVTPTVPPGPPVAAAAPPAPGRALTIVPTQPPSGLGPLPTPTAPGPVTPTVPGSAGQPSRAPPVSEEERIARDRFLRGDYEGAIDAYRRALQELPQAPPRVHQDLALASMHAGRLSEALAEYRIAAEGYRDQIAAGRDVPSAQLGLAVCEAGIRALEQLP